MSGLYTTNTIVRLVAAPDPGYQVKAWTGTNNDASTSNNNNVTMNGDRFVTVEFEAQTYDLDVTILGGHGTCSPLSGAYTANTVVNLVAVPDPGYQVKAWTDTDNDASTSNSNTVTMDRDRAVTVEFEASAKSADIDRDGDVDLADFGVFSACFNGPNRPPVFGSCASLADFDSDGDVDLTDFGVFSACFNGPNRPPACP